MQTVFDVTSKFLNEVIEEAVAEALMPWHTDAELKFFRDNNNNGNV